MNVYDQAQLLAKALKESNEYRTFKELEKKMKVSPSIKNMMEEFKKKESEVQSAQMMGRKVDDITLEKLQELHSELMKDSTIEKFMEAELRLTQMMTDIYKILGESTEVDVNREE